MSEYRRRQLEAAARVMLSRRQPALPPPEDPRVADPLHGVTFASKAAQRYAEGHGMTWRTFADSLRVPSSPSGWTKLDTMTIHAETL